MPLPCGTIDHRIKLAGGPCCGGDACACGGRLTAVFTGVGSSFCLEDFIWPMGINANDISGKVWCAFVDGGCATIPCTDVGQVAVTVNCITGVGWFITADDGATAFFSASEFDALPIGTSIPNSLPNGGSVVITCDGEWGSCCFGTICFGCADTVTGLPGGIGQAQCETLIGGGGAVWQGDHATCNPDPCGGGSPC